MIASNDIKPDITILLDLNVKTGLARARGRNINVNVLQSNLSEGRFEEETLDFHEKVREGFLKIASEEPDRVKVVDATKGIEKIQKEIIRIVEMEQKKIAV
jgi:dTMP kinase